MFRNGLFSLSVAALFIATLSSCDNEHNQQVQDSKIHTVKLIKITDTGRTKISRFPVVIDAQKVADLSLQVSGLLRELPVKEGQTVKRGDLLARLDQKELNNAMISSRIELDYANERYLEAIELSDGNDSNTLEQRKLQRDTAELQFGLAQKTIADSTMHAPFSGFVIQVLAKPLQNIEAKQPIVKLMSSEVLKIELNLSADIIEYIPNSKDSNKYEIEAFVTLDDEPNQTVEVLPQDVSLLSDELAQNHAVTFTFEPPENITVLPGAKGMLELRFQDKSKSLFSIFFNPS